MSEDIHDPAGKAPESEDARPARDPGERLREQIAAARRSVEASLRDVLGELEREEAALCGEASGGSGSALDERIEVAAQRAAERAVRGLARRVDQQVEHVDRALTLIGESERRMIELSDRLEDVGHAVVRALDVAARVTEWEQRIDSAVDVEREVADRIAAAERRLRDLTGEDA